MEKEELLNELENQFNLTKKRLKFKASFEELKRLFYIDDMVLSHKFVSSQFSRQMINWMIDSPSSWTTQLYSWILPGQMDIVNSNESKIISKEEKQEILFLIERIMYLVRKNKRIAFGGLNSKEEGELVDEIVEFKKTYYDPLMLKLHLKFENLWKEEIQKEK